LTHALPRCGTDYVATNGRTGSLFVATRAMVFF
jgi:hypothetical protein